MCVCVCSGWISALTGLNKSIPVGIIMILIAALFTASAVISLIMFKKVKRLLANLWKLYKVCVFLCFISNTVFFFAPP